MKTRQSVRIALIVLSMSLSILANYPSPAIAVNREPAPQNIVTGIKDEEAVSITVYNSDLGLVRDTRRLTLPDGLIELRFSDVAAKIMPQTVLIKSLTAPDQLVILEQNYEYDLLTPGE